MACLCLDASQAQASFCFGCAGAASTNGCRATKTWSLNGALNAKALTGISRDRKGSDRSVRYEDQNLKQDFFTGEGVRMAVRIVTYDLNEEKKKRGDYAGLLKLIKVHPYVRLSESSYAIETDRLPEDLYLQFQSYLDQNDYLVVLTAESPWWAKQRQDVLDWLHQRL
jgi:hypothetical protein